jgi:hypothetical protein
VRRIFSEKDIPVYVWACFLDMTVEEITEYFDGDMDISHLCHHPWCINPAHFVPESHARDMSRAPCPNRARHCRARRLPAAENCASHNPPCQLALAAIDTIGIIWDAFKVAKGIVGTLAELHYCIGTQDPKKVLNEGTESW